MKTVLLAIQIIISIVLVVLILIQSKGTGLGRTFGMGGGSQVSFARRGLEKVIFRATFVATIIFILVSIFQVIA